MKKNGKKEDCIKIDNQIKMNKRKELKIKIDEELNKYSKAFAAIDKFYSDLSGGKISEKDFPHDHAKNALENQKIIIELIDQLKKLEKG